jgi:hypothetical protein
MAWIAGRPAAGACSQVDNGEPPGDPLLIGEVGGERCATPGEGDIHYFSVCTVHFVLWNVRKVLAG